MSSLASPVCLLGGLRVPGLQPRQQQPHASTSGGLTERLTLRGTSNGQYHGNSGNSSGRQMSSLSFVGSFRNQNGNSDQPPPAFVRPDMLDSIDETDGTFSGVGPADLEEVDMAALNTMKLSKNPNGAPSSRSALEQASFMTNETLYKDGGDGKQQGGGKKDGKGRFGMLGL